jgi:hypothetical protein
MTPNICWSTGNLRPGNWPTKRTASGVTTTGTHPLHFKKVSGYWVARISEDYRAVGIESAGTVAWFWIGPHDEYDRLLAR